MKKYLFFLFLLSVILNLTSCKGNKTYTIVALKSDTGKAIIVIDKKTYTFTENEFKKEIELKKYDVVSISLDWGSTNNTGDLELKAMKRSKDVAKVNGNRYMYIILTRDDPSSGGGGYGSSSGSGSGSGSGCHDCGAPTKDGTPCQRRVCDGHTYCWQHR